MSDQANMVDVKVQEILKCRKQIVSGVNYKILALLTNKKKADFKIFTLAWSNTIQIQEF